ncbi:hypothetical protein SteCoe_6692 [Stentor coeruleus]|uniref:Uncharacterized protein n=1 Tax=Stentor coeruleus TaxID=5963 RepID=A0A1R2CPA0_9CILI|nr:hypothetical protein SteCoe_6692 [Stentor coeruleus]
MVKSTSCFSVFNCLKKKRSTSEPKLRASVRLPTLREFLHTSNNAGTQVSVYPYGPPKTLLTHTKSLQNSNPQVHRSTLAIRNDKSFIPLTSFDYSKEENKSQRINSPEQSLQELNSLNNTKNNTLFMSKSSFDAIFTKVGTLSKKGSRRIGLPLEEVEERKNDLSKVCNPFIVTDNKKPKIVAITPMKWKRNSNVYRPNIKLNLKPKLAAVRESDYLCSTSTSRVCNMNLCNDLVEIDLVK